MTGRPFRDLPASRMAPSACIAKAGSKSLLATNVMSRNCARQSRSSEKSARALVTLKPLARRKRRREEGVGEGEAETREERAERACDWSGERWPRRPQVDWVDEEDGLEVEDNPGGMMGSGD